jgi:serine/threonine protein kinase
MADASSIEVLVSRWQDLRQAGKVSSPEELCADCPQLLPELRERLKRMAAMEKLLAPTGQETDSGVAAHEMETAAPGGVPPTEDPKGFPFLGPPQGADELGQLGEFRIVRLLGQGGMGAVFEAEDPVLQRRVALKVMLPQIAAEATARQRFLREARAMAAVQHKRIIAVHQCGEATTTAGPVPFLVMPLLRGETLGARLKREPRPPLTEVMRIGREMAEGLAVAHAAGLIHRDVKPENVWLETRHLTPRPPFPPGREKDRRSLLPPVEEGSKWPALLPPLPSVEEGGQGGKGLHVKLLDFGLARAAEPEVMLSQRGTVVGTAAYMAPEQAAGEAVDGRSDLFSLGCVLYEMTTGQRPFTGPNLTSILMRIANHHPTPPHQLDAKVPAEWSELVMRLLAKKPGDRPASAAEVVAAIRSTDTGSPDLFKTEAAARRSVDKPRGGRRWATAAGVGLGVVLLTAALAVVFFRSSGPTITTNRPEAGAHPSVPVAALRGDIDVLIWEKGNPRRQNLRLGDAGALPLKAGDRFAVLAELERPAYVYIVWIGADGEVEPLYPWTPGDWNSRPAEEKPIPSLRRPEALDDFYKLPTGTPGMETLVLLAGETPLPPNVDLRAELGTFGKQTEQDIRACVWFENGKEVRDRPGREGRFDTTRIDDPVMVAQQRIKEKLLPHFQYTRAVSFANQGK